MSRQDRFKELVEDPYITEQVQALYEPYRLLVGINNAQSVETLVRDVALGILALESMPECVQTRGGPLVVQRGMFSYELMLRAPQIFPMQMTPYPGDKFKPCKVGAIVVSDEPLTPDKETW